MRALWIRGRLWLLTAVSGGGLFVMEGCDPTVRDQVFGWCWDGGNRSGNDFYQCFLPGLDPQWPG